MKWGLGESYSNTSVIPERIRAYLDLTKPASSLGVSIAFLFGSLFYFYYYNISGQIGNRLSDIVFATITVALAHGASQALNMAEDAEMDAQTEHKKTRPIPSGLVSVDEARTIAWILILISIWRSYTVSTQFGAMITLTVFLGVFYNLGPIRAKERWISIPWQSVSRGLLMFPVIWSAYGTINKVLPWVLGLFMFFYVFGFQNSADIIDKRVDEEHGIKTLIVMYGVKGVAVIASGCMFMMIAVVTLGVSVGVVPRDLVSMLLIIPFCLFMLYHMVFNPNKIDHRTGNHPAWMWFYGGMMMAVLIPFLTELVT